MDRHDDKTGPVAQYAFKTDGASSYSPQGQKIFTGRMEVFPPEEGRSKLGTLIFYPNKTALLMEGSNREILIEYPSPPGQPSSGIQLVFYESEHFKGHLGSMFAALIASGNPEEQIARDISITCLSPVKHHLAEMISPKRASGRARDGINLN